ncbi:uncharacterized protein YukE [Actinoalloteichus hoggarensis]|uniref:Uncharacterized protein n=1 Tax=Actinoalloteichus hoggarensis TaxID=1470176 RepID=A0A221W784_9PSEU|nr:hypothetical protein [Actinoalloteichus hoggarensis]ASO21506.1 hypothetical protein AHOG_19420 [Actinoalloteichus hoggarensis]MBB5922095.1 uncharacterized protein YukE [Actinoalloteichus hoggarensis]
MTTTAPLTAISDHALEFPQGEADYILEQTAGIGDNAVHEAIESIRGILGNRAAILQAEEAWGVNAKREIAAAASLVSACRSDLAAFWQGGAADSFNIYIDHVEATCSAAEAAFGEIASLLQEMESKMVEVYVQALDFMAACAANLAEAAGGVLAAAEDLLFGVSQAVLGAAARFIEDVNQLLTGLLSAAAAFDQQGRSARSAVIDIDVPQTVPRSATDTAGWNVRERPAQ